MGKFMKEGMVIKLLPSKFSIVEALQKKEQHLGDVLSRKLI